jgi:diaminopimelate epimerase
MKIAFTKMQGAGNDFVVLDNLDDRLRLTSDQIRRLCDRRFGVGGDGLLLLQKPTGPQFDARMIYYNSDGSRGEMCGNGARCFTAFALAHELGRDGRVRFLTDAGPMSATVADGLYTIQMTPPVDLKLNLEIPLRNEQQAVVHYVNTGVPHVVRFVEDLARVDILSEGAELRRHQAFAPKGANANFARITDDKQRIEIRTYERGVEAETLACGTGVTATAIIAHLLFGVEKPIQIQVAGGDTLRVDFDREGESLRNVTLTGPAKVVFEGTVEI